MQKERGFPTHDVAYASRTMSLSHTHLSQTAYIGRGKGCRVCVTNYISFTHICHELYTWAEEKGSPDDYDYEQEASAALAAGTLLCVAVGCTVLQLQLNVLQCIAAQCAAVCCSVWQCVAVCCSTL